MNINDNKKDYKSLKQTLDKLKNHAGLAEVLYNLGLNKWFLISDSTNEELYDLRIIFETTEGRHEYSWKDWQNKLKEEEEKLKLLPIR